MMQKLLMVLNQHYFPQKEPLSHSHLQIIQYVHILTFGHWAARLEQLELRILLKDTTMTITAPTRLGQRLIEPLTFQSPGHFSKYLATHWIMN